jgi:hypothetical protein
MDSNFTFALPTLHAQVCEICRHFTTRLTLWARNAIYIMLRRDSRHYPLFRIMRRVYIHAGVATSRRFLLAQRFNNVNSSSYLNEIPTGPLNESLVFQAFSDVAQVAVGSEVGYELVDPNYFCCVLSA